MKILVTGAVGFIGMHSSTRLLMRGNKVVGIDNLNDYYDVSLKRARLNTLIQNPSFTFHQIDIADLEAMKQIFLKEKPDIVINLAAQAGVRYSLTNPHAYIEANIQGFMNILECCRHNKIKNLVYASSSSVYGGNKKMPFNEHHNIDHPVSLYAATKKANELMAHTYSHLYRLPTTGLRFFTVYGPWGRPDMALFLFTKAMLNGNAINVFNNGEMIRDFTYVDDIVEGIIRIVDKPATPNNSFDPLTPDPATSDAPYRVFNIGNGNPISLMDYIHALEVSLGIKAKINMMPIQPGDVPATSADTNELSKWIDFQPNTPVKIGVQKFVDWYLSFYDPNNQ